MTQYPGPPTGDPVSTPPTPPTPPAEASRWRSLSGLATSLTWLLALDAAGALFVVVAIANRLGVVNDIEDSNFSLDLLERAQDSDDLVSAASISFGIFTLATAVCFMVWMWRAAKNNEALGRRGARFGPGWAIGAWFIPIANFVIPVMMMQDLWRGSDMTIPRAMYWKNVDRSNLIALWWTAFLLHIIRIGWSGNTESPDLSEIRSSNRIALVSAAFGIVAAVLAIFVVRRLSDRQEACLKAQQAAWAELQNTPPAVG